MEAPYHSAQPASHGGDSRPSVGFPLGTALLLVVIFSLSGICSCCYHWDKLRRRSLSFHATADLEAAASAAVLRPSKPIIPLMNLKQQETQSLPVIMAGDNVPKFIALPCPCEPPRMVKIIDADLQKPPSLEAVGAHHCIHHPNSSLFNVYII
ncbi:glutamine dumper 2 [Striga asiatica]|uniref:Glutamine dumper 2 n=1 Tax=Striga asiatica TaxID=4170 RepID=A0A5A7PCS8_STRAF|nr:glutamine dumper 2 [Striga asiatica]